MTPIPSQPRGDFHRGVVLVEQKYLEEVKKRFPTVRSEEISEHDAGWDYFVCAVKGRIAFRFPRREHYARQLPNEVAFLRDFAPLSPVRVPVPTLEHLPDGTPYVTYDFIPGEPFTVQTASTLTDEEMDGIACQLASFLSALHSSPPERVAQLGFQVTDVRAAHQDRIRETEYLVYPLLNPSEQKWLGEQLDRFRGIVEQQPIKIVPTHTDLLPEHMIIDPLSHRLNGVIDYGDLELNDPAIDFTFLGHYGKCFLTTVYKHYLPTRDDLFETRRCLYDTFLYALDLTHMVEQGNASKISFFKDRLSDHILAAQRGE